MITTREDLKFYLQEDAKSNGKESTSKCNITHKV